MKFEDQFLKYLNLAREHPAYFVPILEQQINAFTNDRELSLAEDVLYQTNQGKSLWLETRSFLMAQKQLPPVQRHYGLQKAATDHQKDVCRSGNFGHTGTDGSTFSQRILKYCKKGPGAMAQIIGSDFDFPNRNTAQMTILSLIIDDGVRERGHRKTIFSPTYRYVGWSSGKMDQKIITVFNFTQNFLQEQNTSYGKYTEPSNMISRSKNQVNNFSRSLGFQQSHSPVKDVQNLSYQPTNKKSIDFSINCDKKVSQKFQDTRSYYEKGCKVIETTVRYIYKDGSVEENVQKRTIYPDQ